MESLLSCSHDLLPDGSAVISIAGRVDALSAGEFQDFVLPLINGRPYVVIDLGGVPYMSSSGLRVIAMAAKTAKTCKASLALCSLADEVRKVFKLAGFDMFVPIFSDRESALSAHIQNKASSSGFSGTGQQ